MKKIYGLLSVMLLSVNSMVAQSSNSEETAVVSNSYGSDSYNRNVIPNQRTIAGGTVINFTYNDEEWADCPEGIAAFQLACQIWEEKLYTAFPLLIKIERKPLRGSNAGLVKTLINGSIKSGPAFSGHAPNALKKRKMFSRDIDWSGNYDVNLPDGIITFNSNAEFYYSLDDQDADKYYFVTTALREIAKILGFHSEATMFNNDLLFSVNGAQSPYCSYFLQLRTNFNREALYQWATSENVWASYYCAGSESHYSVKKNYMPHLYSKKVSHCAILI